MMNKIRSTIGGLALIAGTALGATNDASRLNIKNVLYRGSPAVELTASNLSTNLYNVQYTTNLVNGVWNTDNTTISASSPKRILVKKSNNCFYRLMKQ